MAGIKAVPVNAQVAAKQKADELVAYVKNIPDTATKAAKVCMTSCGRYVFFFCIALWNSC